VDKWVINVVATTITVVEEEDLIMEEVKDNSSKNQIIKTPEVVQTTKQ